MSSPRRGLSTFSAGAAFAVSVMLASAPAGEPGSNDYEQERVELAGAFVASLDGLAVWCQENRLLGNRDATYEVLLHFDQDHAVARRVLKYRQQPDGTWVQRRGYKPRANKGKNIDGLLAEYDERFAEASSAYRNGVLELSNSYVLDPESQSSLWADVLALDPDDVTARAALGEVRWGDSWVLAESAASLSAANVEASSDSAIPFSITVDGHGADEARAVIERAVRTFLERVPGARAPRRPLVVHLTDAAGRDEFLARKEFDEATRQAARSCTSAWIPATRTAELAVWESPEFRVEAAIRQVVALLCLESLGLDRSEVAWAFEGLGIYVTREAFGTHITSFAPGVHFARPNGVADVFEPDTLERIAAGRISGLDRVVGLPLDQMKQADVAYSWALVRYLIEGHPDKAARLLPKLGAGQASAEALATMLETDLGDLEAKVARWAREVAAAS